MKITFLGAAGCVTGSCYLIETQGKKILVDCGMFQGSKDLKKRNFEDFAFNPGEIDCVIVTHAHIDHSGLLPKLFLGKFQGSIFVARPTADLLSILLNDVAHIQKYDTERKNKYRKRKGLPVREPLYLEEQVALTLDKIVEKEYHSSFSPLANIEAVFRDAGHIMGSSFLELIIEEKGIKKKIIFGGDLGQSHQAVIKDPEVSESADVIIIESTYGNRLHKKYTDTQKELLAVLKEIVRSKGTLIIPAFAVGRTQSILYQLFEILRKNNLHGVTFYVDSPMGNKVTHIYSENKDLYDDKTVEYLKGGENPLDNPFFKFTTSASDSMKINNAPGPKVIVSSSGMCEGGRVMHHLKHQIWKENTHIMFVGYQGKGTLGRRLVEGAKKVKIMGSTIGVKAKVHTIGGLSAHADQAELLSWLKFYKESSPYVFVTHGEPDSSQALSDVIKEQLQFDTDIPDWLDEAYLTFEKEGITVSKTAAKIDSHYLDEKVKWNDYANQISSLLESIDNSTVENKRVVETFLNQANKQIADLIDEFGPDIQ